LEVLGVGEVNRFGVTLSTLPFLGGLLLLLKRQLYLLQKRPFLSRPSRFELGTQVWSLNGYGE